MHKFERHTRPWISILVAASMLVWCVERVEAQDLTVVGWGGATSRARVKAYHERYIKETGISINLEDYNGGLAQIRAQVTIGNVFWDVVNMEFADLARGCDEGLFEPLSIDEFSKGADGSPAIEDFVDGTILECGVAMWFAATVYAYNRESIPGEVPSTIADFFDLDRFPGRRGCGGRRL